MSGKEEQNEVGGAATELHILVNPALPNVFADKLQVLMSSENFAVLRWVQSLPEGNAEVSRVVVSHDHLKRIIDVLCRVTSYYPDAAAQKVATPPKKG